MSDELLAAAEVPGDAVPGVSGHEWLQVEAGARAGLFVFRPRN